MEAAYIFYLGVIVSLGKRKQVLQKQVCVKHGDLSTDKVPALSLILALGGSFMSSCTLKKGIGARERKGLFKL